MLKKTPGKLKDMIWKIVRFLDMGSLVLRFYPNSMLLTNGWFRSFREGLPVDRQGNAIPWFTYSFIEFIRPRLRKEMRLFEYGSGHSTLWFSNQVNEVIAVENNSTWVRFISSKVPDNCKIILREAESEYINAITENKFFDVVVIDGVYREKCFLPAVEALKDDGVIIWDNSERKDFAKSIPLFQSKGFKEISFYGLVPGHFVSSQTSVLYREINCLQI